MNTNYYTIIVIPHVKLTPIYTLMNLLGTIYWRREEKETRLWKEKEEKSGGIGRRKREKGR